MGGKNKPNRTKNNARPSSSARSAELLQNQNATIFGLGSVKDGAVSIMSNKSDLVDNNYSTEFQLALKKMAKKDSTTKLKALQEFSDLCIKAETEDVKIILPNWVHLYCQLCGDNEHRVREAVQRSHKVVITKVKKYLAPYLKEIIGPWFTAQYDTYAPAASAAVAAFEESFSPPKMAEVIAFCQDEILNYFYSNLVVLTPQNSGYSKTLSAEELEDRYRRFVSSSLQGYAFYLQKTPQKNLEAGEELNNKILSSPRFWKLAQHKDPNIRYGFFKAIIALSQYGVEFIKPKANQLASAIFNHLSEEDSIVLPVIWEAVLSAGFAVPECWNYSVIEKQLTPKLLQLLRCGGKGHALTIFPKLLPLLSKFPLQKMDNVSEFYSKLFSNMRTGLLDPSVNRSISESRVVANTFVECLQYMIMINREDQLLVTSLIKNELIAAIASSFQLTQLVTQPLICQVASMLRTWHKNTPSYDFITCLFWSEFENSFNEYLKTLVCQETIDNALKNKWEMLSILKTPGKYSPKRNREKVRFRTENEEGPFIKEERKESKEPLFDKALEEYAKNLTQKYIDSFKINGNWLFIKALLELANVFDSRIIYPNLDDLESLLPKVLNKDIPQEVSVQFGFKLLTHGKEDKQISIINTLINIENLDFYVFSRCLLKCLTKPVREWIKTQYYSEKYLDLLNDVFSKDDIEKKDNVDILSGFISPEFLLDNSICPNIISKISETVTLKKCIDFIEIFINGFGIELCSCGEFNELVINLFKVSSDPNSKKFNQFLKIILLKFKYHRMNESASLIATIKNNIILSNGNSEHLVSIITTLIETLYDININEVCEQEEIEQLMPILKQFLQPPTDVFECSILFAKYAAICKEVSGDHEFSYFNLNNTKGDPLNIDTKILQHFQDKYASKVDLIELTDSLVCKYLDWIEMVTILISQVLTAYPVTYRVAAMSKHGRYVINPNDPKTIENISEDDMPICLSKEEWLKLEEEAAVQFAFVNEYPDANMIHPILNEVLYIIESAAAIETLKDYYPEIEQYPMVKKKAPEIFKLVQNMISSVTPKEMEFVYNMCQDLVKYEKQWCGLLPSLKLLFCRQFKKISQVDTKDTIRQNISEIVHSETLMTSCEAIAKITAIVKYHAHYIPLEEWQIIFVQLDKFVKMLNANFSLDEKNLQSAAIVSSFFTVAKTTFLNCLARKEDELIFPEVISMWNEIVEKELWNEIFQHWRQVVAALLSHRECEDLEVLTDTNIKGIKCYEALIRRISEAVDIGLNLREHKSWENNDQLLATQAASLLTSPQVALQITAFKILLSLVPQIVQEDTALFQGYAENDEKDLFSVVRDCDWTINILKKTLETTQTVIDAMLTDFKLGHTCTVQPFNDAFTYTHAYLLLWCVIMEMCGEAHVALRYQYAAWLKHQEFLHSFLKSAFNLMPAQVTHGETARDTTCLFVNYGELSLNAKLSSTWIEQRTCFVYRMCLQRLPGAVRAWWSEQEHHVANLISKTTSIHVSPILIASELKNVQNPDMPELENVTVNLNLATREVIGTFPIDDTPMQITICLPTNYPLGLIQVESTHSSLPKTWRISVFLMHRNGSLRDALALWKSDLDKKFGGVEECKICYSVLHGSNNDIPKQKCKTCQKKFHAACLLKWFNTSNKSTCPHCRNQY